MLDKLNYIFDRTAKLGDEAKAVDIHISWFLLKRAARPSANCWKMSCKLAAPGPAAALWSFSPQAPSVASRGRSWWVFIRMRHLVGCRLVFLLTQCMGILLQSEIRTWSSPTINKRDFHLTQPLGLLMLLWGIML